MAEGRDSKKNSAEIYATELVRLQGGYYRDLATRLSTPVPATPTPAPTVPATGLQVYLPVIMIAGGFLGLITILRH